MGKIVVVRFFFLSGRFGVWYALLSYKSLPDLFNYATRAKNCKL